MNEVTLPGDDPSLDLITTAVLLADAQGRVTRANQAAESTFDASRRWLQGQPVRSLFVQASLIDAIVEAARQGKVGQQRLLAAIRRPLREPLPVQLLATTHHQEGAPLVLEIFEAPAGLRSGPRFGEERRSEAAEANRRLLRNLAHEIKNPLGGIRGAAQLLQAELPGPELRDFTRVIISESDRLQALLDRVLAPHRGASRATDFNIHEVCERVRSVILAEHPGGLEITRDYDASVPDCHADREQLIQVVLNIVRNAAQALAPRIAQGDARIELRTRIARQVTFARRHCRLALDLRITDNGPGVPEDIRDRIFDPLVSGREDGSGLGLALAQTFVDENDGMIDFDSEPGRTQFRILLPLDAGRAQ